MRAETPEKRMVDQVIGCSRPVILVLSGACHLVPRYFIEGHGNIMGLAYRDHLHITKRVMSNGETIPFPALSS